MSESVESVSTQNGDELIVEQVKAELEEIDNSDLSEHAARFESLHEKLTGALNSIDGL
jgi:hypothetical protein